MEDISILLAFSAGLLSFLSPCVLPLIPAYVSYLTGFSVKELKENKGKLFTLYRSLGFVLGFSIVFIIMGLSVTVLGKAFASHRELFRKAGAVIIILFGIHMTGLIPIKLLYREKRYMKYDKLKGPFGSLIMGMAFAAGWTPCIGPILSSILIYAANTASLGKGVLLLSVYSLGLAVPFVLTAMAIESFSKFFHRFSKHLPIVSIISGLFMIMMGILIYTNRLALLSRFTFFPGIG